MVADDDEFWQDKVIQVAGVGVSTIASLEGAPVLVAAAAFAVPVVSMLRKAFAERGARLRAGYDSMLPDESVESAAARLASRVDDPGVQGVYLEAFRRLQEALDPDAMFALGRLLWIYENEQGRPDWFFRGMSRLLSDLEAGDLQELQTFISCFSRAATGSTAAALDVVAPREGVAGTKRLEIHRGLTTTYFDGVPNATRLFLLLKQNGLARDRGIPPGAFGHVGEQNRGPWDDLTIDVDVVSRIERIVGPALDGRAVVST